MKKTVSIKKSHDFSKVYKKGKSFAGKHVILYVLKNGLDINRLGITASRRYGKSVRRNRIRRLIRENYRLYEDRIKVGNDLVFLARRQDTMPGYREINKEMGFLLKRLDLMS